MEKENKIVKHFIHTHPLRLSEVEEEDLIICSGCDLTLTGSAYKCTKRDCDFIIHKSCFELPQEVQHESHAQHSLILVQSPSFEGFYCDACGRPGCSFHFHCKNCQFDLHVGCESLPETVNRKSHEHPLSLLYKFPYKEEDHVIMFCGVCNGVVSESYWLYYCQKCEFCVHLDCAAAEEDTEKPQEQEQEQEQEEEEEEEEATEDEEEEEEEEVADGDVSEEEEEVNGDEIEEEEDNEEGSEEGTAAEETLNRLIVQNQLMSLTLHNQMHRQRLRMMRKMAPTRVFFPSHF